MGAVPPDGARPDGVADRAAGRRPRRRPPTRVAERLRDAGYAPFPPRPRRRAPRGCPQRGPRLRPCRPRESVRRARRRGCADAPIVVVSLISPRTARAAPARAPPARATPACCSPGGVPGHCRCRCCEDRDPRHLYDRARRSAEIAGVTGVDDQPYERPEAADLVIHPGPQSVAEAADAVDRGAPRARPRRGAAALTRTPPPAPGSPAAARAARRARAISSIAAANRDSSTGWTTITSRACSPRPFCTTDFTDTSWSASTCATWASTPGSSATSRCR